MLFRAYPNNENGPFVSHSSNLSSSQSRSSREGASRENNSRDECIASIALTTISALAILPLICPTSFSCQSRSTFTACYNLLNMANKCVQLSSSCARLMNTPTIPAGNDGKSLPAKDTDKKSLRSEMPSRLTSAQAI